MRVTNTAEVTGIKYRMPIDLVGGNKSNRKSSRRGISRNGNEVQKFDVDAFVKNELGSIGNGSLPTQPST